MTPKSPDSGSHTHTHTHTANSLPLGRNAKQLFVNKSWNHPDVPPSDGFPIDVDAAAHRDLFEIKENPMPRGQFSCVVCGEVFKQPQVMKDHQKDKHSLAEILQGKKKRIAEKRARAAEVRQENQAPARFTCGICGEGFVSPVIFSRHQKDKHTPEEIVAAKKQRKHEQNVAYRAKRKEVDQEKAPTAKEGDSALKEPERKGNRVARTAEDRRAYYLKNRKKILARQKALKAAKRKEVAAQGEPPKETRTYHRVEGNGTSLPVPFRYCFRCGETLPTMEHRGKVLPLPANFCPYCRCEMPVIGK